MVDELKMPQMGYDMEEGTVVRWLKEENSHVDKNEAIAEIETDKAVVEFESESSGILLKIVAPEGTIVPVGQTIAIVGTEGESIDINENELIPQLDEDLTESPSDSESVAIEESTDKEIPIEESVSGTPNSLSATPIARKMADELGISLSTISGSGPGGRITKKDIELYNSDKSSSKNKSNPPKPTSISIPDVPKPRAIQTNDIEPLTRMRQQIARVTLKSKTEKPHFYVSADIDMTSAMQLRGQINAKLKDEGIKVSVNDLIVKACIEALKKYPKFNAYFSEEGITFNDTINIAIAISGEEGLIVPAILDCGDKSLKEISKLVKDLASRSDSGTLSTEEYTGGTFAISNLGMFDVTSFVAIIHPPQSAVLAIGTVQSKPAVVDGEIAIRDMMTATLSGDHRIVDGAEGAQFIIEVKRLLETPVELVI
tara:strand:- start:2825 stop:4108 length:1284 start_codon:yes stop_codon:yes gene_type:complete